MTENHVSGLPVLSGKDRCVGVISSSDILSLEQEHTLQDDESLGSYFDADSQRWEHIRVAQADEMLADVFAKDVMSRALVAVPPDAPAREVARLMVEHEVHRVLVLDDKQLLHGIVSASDFVQMVASERE
jgi:CBS domain-containing protein